LLETGGVDVARIALPEGEQLDIVKALSMRPKLAAAVGAMNDAVFASTLDWRLHEIVRMRIAQINGCTVCLAWRTPEALEAGVTDQLLADVAVWRTSPEFSDAERVALEFTELFCGDSVSISDDLMARLAQHFDPGEIVELSLVIGKYLSQGRFMQVLGLDQDSCAVPAGTGATR
jgi:AhpD family alkylhydroperoxidase